MVKRKSTSRKKKSGSPSGARVGASVAVAFGYTYSFYATFGVLLLVFLVIWYMYYEKKKKNDEPNDVPFIFKEGFSANVNDFDITPPRKINEGDYFEQQYVRNLGTDIHADGDKLGPYDDDYDTVDPAGYKKVSEMFHDQSYGGDGVVMAGAKTANNLDMADYNAFEYNSNFTRVNFKNPRLDTHLSTVVRGDAPIRYSKDVHLVDGSIYSGHPEYLNGGLFQDDGVGGRIQGAYQYDTNTGYYNSKPMNVMSQEVVMA